MKEAGIVRRSKSPWSSPLHIVPKQSGGWRPCSNYRRLNEATTDDRYPLPHIQNFNSRLTGSCIFSKIDLIRGYYQIPMTTESIPKTAIATPFSLWEFLRMPFGLKNATQTFQRFMDGILQDLDFAFVYLVDISIASKSKLQHLEHLRRIFELLSSNGLIINKSKCVFGVSELDYLGHLVISNGICPLTGRIQVNMEFPIPQTRGELQRFLGMINYCHPSCLESLPSSLLCTQLLLNAGKTFPGRPTVKKHLRKPRVHCLTVHCFITHGPMQRPALLWTHLIPPLERNLNNYKGVVGC